MNIVSSYYQGICPSEPMSVCVCSPRGSSMPNWVYIERYQPNRLTNMTGNLYITFFKLRNSRYLPGIITYKNIIDISNKYRKQTD